MAFGLTYLYAFVHLLADQLFRWIAIRNQSWSRTLSNGKSLPEMDHFLNEFGAKSATFYAPYVKAHSMRGGKKDAVVSSPKMMSLNIGENDPVGNQLVAMELNEASKIKPKKEGRKKSISRIFGKVVLIDTDNAHADSKIRKLQAPSVTPRKSLFNCSPIPFSLDDDDGDLQIVASNAMNTRKKSFTPIRPQEHKILPRVALGDSDSDDQIFS